MKRQMSSAWLVSGWLVAITALPTAHGQTQVQTQVQARSEAQAPTQPASPASQPKARTPSVWARLMERARLAGKTAEKLVGKHHRAAEQVNHTQYDAMVAEHAKANGVPEALVHRVILRESRYQPQLIGRGGCIGMMQIKLGTARGLGYTGDAEGLRDANTNLTYGIKYLAGAYRAANGDHDRAVALYTTGYYEVAKRQRLDRARNPAAQPAPVLASAPKQDAAKQADKQTVKEAAKEAAKEVLPPAPDKNSAEASAKQLPEKGR
jgi:soluble lytic murein transglycosylase-like protein